MFFLEKFGLNINRKPRCAVQELVPECGASQESPVYKGQASTADWNTVKVWVWGDNAESSTHAGCAASHLARPPLLCLWFTGSVRLCRFTSLSSPHGKPCVAVAVQGGGPPLVHCGSCILMVSSFVPNFTLSKNQSGFFSGSLSSSVLLFYLFIYFFK